MHFTRTLIALCCAFGVSSSHALTLAEAYAFAVEHDPRLKAAESNVIATREEMNKSNAGYLPKVQLSLSRGKGSTETETGNPLSSGSRDYDTQNYSLNLKQPLFNLSLSQDKNKAQAHIQMSQYQYLAENLNLFSRVAERYFAVLYAQDVVNNQQQTLKSFNAQLIQAQKRFTSGVGIKNDINDLEAEIAVTQAKIMESETRLITTRKNLQALMGIAAPDMLNQFDVAKVNALNLSDLTLDDYLSIAKKSNPQLLEAYHEIELNKFDYEKLKAAHYPTVDLVLARSYTESDSNITIGNKYNTLSGMVQLNVPLYAGGYTSANARQAATMIEVARSNADAKYSDISEKITDEFTRLQSSKSLIKAYQRAINSYELSVEGTNKAFLAGTRTLSDILQLQQKLDETKLDYSKATYDYLLSYIKLKEYTGEVKQEDFAGIDALN